MQIIKNLIATLLPLALVGYLYFLFSFINRLKKFEAMYWRSIGSPSSFNSSEQLRVTKIIFFPNGLPAEIREKHKTYLYLVRFFAYLFIATFILMIVLVETGFYN